MTEKSINTTSEDVKKSVSSIYLDLLNKRKIEKEFKEDQKRMEKEAKELAKEEKKLKTEDEKPMSRKEKKESQLNSWKEIVIGLTGDDLDYVKPKKNKKKYKKWIDGDNEDNVVLASKPSKKKKKNFNKEFEPEICMLKAIVTDQNKFTADLQRRYQIAAGPNTKDAMPLNKTLVELASVINNSRSNSLGVLNAIGSLKKTIADLYMKQVKLDSDMHGDGTSTQDLAIMGSNTAAAMFINNQNSIPNNIVPIDNGAITSSQTINVDQSKIVCKSFDPESWDGGGLNVGNIKYEAIPHKVVVEWHKESDKARFKAIRNDNGEELIGCPVPTCTIKAIDINTKVAKDDFDQVYQVEIIE